MTARRWTIAIVAVGVIAAVVLWRRAPEAVDRSPAGEATRAAARNEPGARLAMTPPAAAGTPALPGSLDGTDADGALEASGGHLVVSLELRRLFDHFLAASGEEPLATMRARIIAALRAKLPGPPAPAAGEAIDILDRYLAYREAARGLHPASDRDGLDQVHELRAKHFTPEVARVFFADEEATTYAALARRDVLRDQTISEAERQHKLAALDALIPAAERAGRAAAMAPLVEMERERQLRDSGASEAAITASRTAAFGADGAARLAQLDQQRAQWDARLARFRAARAAIQADAKLDEAERQRRIDALLTASFTEQERVRVEALDRVR